MDVNNKIPHSRRFTHIKITLNNPPISYLSRAEITPLLYKMNTTSNIRTLIKPNFFALRLRKLTGSELNPPVRAKTAIKMDPRGFLSGNDYDQPSACF